jgi:hypothetical protein
MEYIDEELSIEYAGLVDSMYHVRSLSQSRTDINTMKRKGPSLNRSKFVLDIYPAQNPTK